SMSEEVDEYASNVRKLQLMGFGNDLQIKEALSSCENDIDSAITFLVNRNFVPSIKSQDIASDEKVGSQSIADDDFPVDKLRTLEESLYIEKWNIPCLRSQSLCLCLSSAIRIIKCRGLPAFVSTEALQRFMTKCVNECLNKFLTSGAVLQWDAGTLEGVHNMLELVIQLAIECLTVGKCFMSHGQQSFQKNDCQNLIMLAFSYLEAIFNPECSYHQRCRDRTTNTGIYVDPFNNWGPAKDSGGEGRVYAEILPAPKNFYLVNLLNCFGAHGGFDLILWYGTRQHLPLKMMQSVLGPLANVAEYLTLETMCRYSGWLMVRTLWLIHNLTSEDFNPQESRVFDLITSLRVLCYRSAALSNSTDSSNGVDTVVPFTLAEFSHPRQPDWDALMGRCPFLPPATPIFSVAHVDERHLAILLSSLCPPVGVSSSFKVRILATRHLIDQISAVQHARSSSAVSKSGLASAGATPVVTSTSILAAENQAFLRRRKLHRLIRYDALMAWVKEKAVVQSIMTLPSFDLRECRTQAHLVTIRPPAKRSSNGTKLSQCSVDNVVTAIICIKVNLDNVTYVATLCELFRCLGDHITMEDISALWKCQETQSNAGINNILKLLSEVGANGFNQAQFEHVLQLVRDSWGALDLQARIQFSRSSGSNKMGMKHRYRHRLSITTTATPVRQPISESATIRNTRVRLLNFVATTAITSREVWVSDLCLQLLWQLAHGLHHKSPEHAKSASVTGEEKGKATFGRFERLVSVLSSSSGSGNGGISRNSVDGGVSTHHPGPLNPEHTEAAMAQLVIVLRECRLPTNEQRHRLNTWLSVAAEELKRGKSTYYVLDFLQTILDLICKPLPGRSKKDTLRELNKTHSLIDTVCNSLHRLQRQVTSKHLIASSSPAKFANNEHNKTIRHGDLIKRHLDVLHYLLSTADLHLSVDRTQDIWDTLVNDYSLILFSVEKTLLWFASALDLLETDAQNSLFTKNILKLPPSIIQTFKGFQCFESFFVKVNLNEGRLKMNQDGWTVERMDLIGVDFLWDLYTSLPTTPNPADHAASNAPALLAGGKVLPSVDGKGDLGVSSEVPLETQIFNCRQAIHKARKLLLLISWSQLSSKLKKDPESCHKRFFDYCRKRIEINLAASTSSLSHSSRVQAESRHLTVERPLQPNLRSLLADTGQFLASLLVGPKAAASARSRLSKSSRLALYRLLYIVFSYIENAEDELIGAHEPPSCWKPHYMSFRGWELRIPLRVLNPSGQLLISSTLPLTARCHTTSFSLCLSDATADYLRNPILVVHSNATLASVRKLVGLVVPVCLYALANTTTQFAFGSEVLSLDSIKPPGVSGLHELTNRNRQAPLSDPKSETPLGHKLDREAIGELGFQTGRTLVIRLRSHAEVQGLGSDINGASSFNISDGMHSSLLRRSSGLSMKSSGSGKLHPPPLPNVASSVSSSSFLPKVASFLHSEKQNPPVTAATVNAIDPACLQSPFTLPSLMLASSRSVYESVFELAESDLAENGTSQIRPNLLHMIRLLLYCLPTYNPPNGLHVSERSGKSASKSVSNAFAASMVCTPENLVKAPQFRLLYLLQFLSGQLVPPESSAWWECAWDPSSAMASARVTEPQRVFLPLESLQARTPPAHRLTPLETEEATSPSNTCAATSSTTSAPVAASASAALISSETCLHIPSTRSLTDANGSTSCPPSPEMVKGPKKRLIGSHHKATKWFIGSGGGKRKDSISESSMTPSKTYEKSDWLEPLVVVLRKQLIEGTVKPAEPGGLLMTGLFVRIVAPNEATGPTSTATDSSRSDAWISREIKHCALQILATLLNPSSFGSMENSGCDSRTSSFSSSCSSLPTLMQSEFAPKLLSVLMDTALASATQTSDQQGGNFTVSSAVCGGGSSGGGGGEAVSGGRNQRRRGLLPVVESHTGVANALDPLTSSASFALTCQDVEIAVQSTRLLCQCVFSYSSQLMSAFLEIPDLKSSLIRLLLYSPSLRIRSETCHQLKQLLYHSAGQHHQSMSSLLGVEPCCHLLAWETSHSSQPPPYTFEAISLHHVSTSPYIDLLLDLFFKTPWDATKGTFSKPLLPPFWTTNQLNTLMDTEERQAIMHCAEFFRMRGRVFAMVEKSCLEHYAGQNHVAIFESEIQWFRSFAQAHPQASSWGDGLLPILDCSLINGHLCFLRTACIQMVAIAIARATSVSRTGGAGCAAPSGHSAPLSTSASWEGGGSRGSRCSGGCLGLSPPPFLLLGGSMKDKGDPVPDSEVASVKKSFQNSLYPTTCHSLPSNSIDSKLTTLVTNCIRLMGNLVPTLLTDYMFPVANAMSEEYHSLPSGDTENHRIHGKTLLQPPPKRLDGNARQEAFMLILFLARMDFQSLERTVNILVRLHHHSPPEEQLQTNHSPNSSMSLPTVSNLGDSGGLTFEADVNITATTSIMWDYRPSLLGRAACNFTGLRNGGATCYMNAVLQQLFMQPGVAEAILDVPTSKLDEKSLLYQTQELFLNLLFSQLQFYDPVGFLKTFRLWNTDTPIDPHEQQDAFDFFQSLIDQLDEGMKKFNDVPFFTKMFHGILSDTMYCEDCGHRYDREQSFSAINLTVCTGDLLEAMRQYTREEVMEGDNAYFCERCQMKQRTLKRLTFSSLPPVLCLQLKRFGFDWERQVAVKSNQAFSFPRRLDMTPFMGDNAVQMPSGVSIQSNVSVDLGGKRNSPDIQPDASKRGFHLYDPEEEYADEEERHNSALTPTAETGPARLANEHAPHHRLHSHSESIEIATPSYVYELSGIVIHSGQAHAGHYYSFIRDRGRMEQAHVIEQKRSQSISGAAGLPGFTNSQNPLRSLLRSDTLTQGTEDYSAYADANPPERWLKFNDTHIEEVEMTDEFLQQECFGGTYLAEVPGRPPEKRTRNYSAYLLFYQRVSSNTGVGVQAVETTRSRRTSDSSGKLRPVSTLNMRRNRHSSLSGEKSHFFSMFDEGRFQKSRFSVDDAHSPASRGSHRSIQFSRPLFTGSSASTASATRQQRLSLAFTPSLLRVSPLAGAHPSSTCLVGLNASGGGSGIGIGLCHGSWNGDSAAREVLAVDLATTAEQPASNDTAASSSADEMLHRIRRRNLAFLRDQSIFSPDYANFVYNLAQGVLADTTALQLEPNRAILGCQLVANFLFTTYLPLHASVKVSISPDLCKRLLGLCAPPPRTGRETHPHQTSASEQASLQEAGAKLDTHWMEMLLSLMTANALTVSWSLSFLVRSQTRPMLNYMLTCPKPLLRHQTARLVGVVLSTFYASKDASILDASLNNLVDYLLDLLPLEVPQYAQHCASYFGLLLGYVETCPHASVHLSNRSGTRRLLSFLVGEDADREETLSIDTGALSPTLSMPTQNASFVVPSIVTPQKDAGFPTWLHLEFRLVRELYWRKGGNERHHSAKADVTFKPSVGRSRGFSQPHLLRNWTASQSKELGNYYLLLAHMLLQSNFDQFRNHPLSPTVSHPSRLSLFPRPETARWLGFSSLATSSDALSQASANDLPPRLRYVGMFLLVEAVIRTYVENPHTPPPPQRQYEQQQQPHLQQQSSVTGSVGGGKADANQTPTHRNSLTGASEELSLRDTMIDVLSHLTHSWWIPSAAFISVLLSLIVTRPLVEIRHYFDLIKQLLRVRDELQSLRVLAVLCGLRGPAWCLRPNFQSTKAEGEAIFGGAATDSCEGVCSFDAGQESSRYPPPPDFAHPGLLNLLTGEGGAEGGSGLDSRRAYQCMKFLVELAAENTAVVEGLSRFPQLWGPAVEWLQSLLEASDAATTAATASFSRTTPLGRHTDHFDSNSPTTTAAGRFRSGTFSGATTSGQTGKPLKKSSSIEDDSWALKRTSSAQTTLTEAARMLATMPGYETRRLQPHREVDQDSPGHASPSTPPTA
ncbi:Ubiquitin carboxyl-terminal hydrolase 24, partial [Taenia solium]